MPISRLTKIVGIKGLYLHLCKTLKKNPIPTKVPKFGLIRTYHEIKNLYGNFVKNELTDHKVELYLSKKQTPCVIDCGVSVGISVRWWFYLNNNARVFGIDMIEEAQKFTIETLKSVGINQDRYKALTAALWCRSGKKFEVGVTDPLAGDNSLYNTGRNRRIFTTKTLDDIFSSEEISNVDLLKIDLEGAGGQALQGASEILKKTKHIVCEIHNEEECKLVCKLLTNSGFILRKASHRQNLWWEKA